MEGVGVRSGVEEAMDRDKGVLNGNSRSRCKLIEFGSFYAELPDLLLFALSLSNFQKLKVEKFR